MASGKFFTSDGIFLKGDFDRTPSLRARDWNARIAEPAEKLLILPGANTFTVRRKDGQIINITSGGGWRHPWFTDVAWRGASGWCAQIRPGFVNGIDPDVAGYGSLLDRPWIPLGGMREIPGSEATPKFFEALGVPTKSGDGLAVDEIGNVTVDVTDRAEDALPRRSLLACDFYVAVARAAYVGEVTVSDGSGVSGEIVDYSVRFDSTQLDRLGARPRLIQAAKMPDVKEPTIYERLEGQFDDDGEDRVLISTVYLLSPPDGLPPANQAWQPFVKHNAFWNLNHAARNEIPEQPYEPIRLFTGLVGGWGDIIANQTLAILNDVSQRVFNAVNTTSNEGRFWSPRP